MRNRKFLIAAILLFVTVVGYYGLRQTWTPRPQTDAGQQEDGSRPAPSPGDGQQMAGADTTLCLSPYLRLTRQQARERADACTRTLDQSALPEP